MTNAELKEALLNKQPVLVSMNDGTELHCQCVTGIIYRAKNKSIAVSAEVTDNNGRCVYISDPKQIRYEV